MNEFKRSQEIEEKLFLEALSGDKHVKKDAQIRILMNHNRYRAYCVDTDTWLQFPTKLRYPGALFLADVIEVSSPGRDTFYRVVKGTIRKNGTVVG